jgi:hypothetical protein
VRAGIGEIVPKGIGRLVENLRGNPPPPGSHSSRASARPRPSAGRAGNRKIDDKACLGRIARREIVLADPNLRGKIGRRAIGRKAIDRQAGRRLGKIAAVVQNPPGNPPPPGSHSSRASARPRPSAGRAGNRKIDDKACLGRIARREIVLADLNLRGEIGHKATDRQAASRLGRIDRRDRMVHDRKVKIAGAIGLAVHPPRIPKNGDATGGRAASTRIRAIASRCRAT